MTDKLTGKVLAGRYQLGKPLTEEATGSAWVYRAVDLNLGRRDCAIKIITHTQFGGYDGETLELFNREVAATSCLNAMTTVKVFDAGKGEIEGVGEYLYLSMELLRGSSLKDHLEEYGPMPPLSVAHLMRAVLLSLREAHGHEFIHRDLKPGNIIYFGDATDRPVAKVLDYGIAKALSPSSRLQESNTQVIRGTPLYLAPEQVEQGQFGPYTDLWALGVIAYKCLVGQDPHSYVGRVRPGSDAIQKYASVFTFLLCFEDITMPEEHRGSALARIVEGLLRADPMERYGSCEDVLRDLEALEQDSGAFERPVKKRASNLDSQEITPILGQQAYVPPRPTQEESAWLTSEHNDTEPQEVEVPSNHGNTRWFLMLGFLVGALLLVSGVLLAPALWSDTANVDKTAVSYTPPTALVVPQGAGTSASKPTLPKFSSASLAQALEFARAEVERAHGGALTSALVSPNVVKAPATDSKPPAKKVVRRRTPTSPKTDTTKKNPVVAKLPEADPPPVLPKEPTPTKPTPIKPEEPRLIIHEVH